MTAGCTAEFCWMKTSGEMRRHNLASEEDNQAVEMNAGAKEHGVWHVDTWTPVAWLNAWCASCSRVRRMSRSARSPSASCVFPQCKPKCSGRLLIPREKMTEAVDPTQLNMPLVTSSVYGLHIGSWGELPTSGVETIENPPTLELKVFCAGKASIHQVPPSPRRVLALGSMCGHRNSTFP